MHSSDVRAEHLLLAIIRERQALPTQVMARMVDLARLDAAVSAEAVTSPPAVTGEGNPASGATGKRRAVEVARALGHDYVGVEHLFLAITRDREALPTRVLARLVDCDQIKATLAELMQGPRMTYGTPQALGDDVVFLPSGVELDGQLRRAIFESLPDGASFRFNWEYGYPWVQVVGPGNTANVLIAALKRLGWPLR
jgi:ATP-dependent Clp protease ATP-binding subunit ClpA